MSSFYTGAGTRGAGADWDKNVYGNSGINRVDVIHGVELDTGVSQFILLKEIDVKVSARNLIPGTVKKITEGAVNAEVVIEVAPGVEVVSIITIGSVKSLGLKEGSQAKAMVKASNVMVVVD